MRHRRERSSGYFRDVEKWNGSRSVQRMSFSERGVYEAMLDEQWLHRILPDDPEQVADLIAITPEHRAEVIAAWPKVRAKFVRAEKGPIRIYNVQLEITRRKQKQTFKSRSVAGRIAGKASAEKRKTNMELVVNDSSTTVERSSTDKSREEESRSEQIRQEVIVQPTARSKRPIFVGQRLTVFEWQLDNCMKTLGPLTNAFDLHEWFGQLDAEAARANLVIPRRDGGEWLDARLLEECQRRGLPIARPVQAGKLTTRLAAAIENIAREA